MRCITINDKYEYLPDFNTIINKELRAITPDDHFMKTLKTDTIKLSPNFLRDAFEKLSHITFEVTQNCNLRCLYCVNNNNYFFERGFSKQSMELEIAKKGLNFFYSKIKDRKDKEISLGFYGGEPLLAFDTIQRIVEYSRKLFKEWVLKFKITTNGTLLSAEMINFFISNWFSVTVSLDGPQSIHDAKRIFKNGKGTFDRIWKNLQKIDEIDSNYFKKKVHFSSVYSKDLPIKERIDFFKHNPLIKDNIGVSSFVNFMHSNYYRKYAYDSEKFWDELNDVINSVKGIVYRKGKLNSSESFFDKMTRLDTLGLRATSDMGGACILTRPLIDVNGKIHFCDKINSKFSFGDVWNGIDLRRLKQIIRDFKQINQRYCIGCDFRFLCQRCYITFAKDGILEYDRNVCESIKRTLMARLEKHVDFKEKEAGRHNESKGNSNNYRYKFHQFVKVVKGRTNSVIIDFLRENAFQVENKLLHEFENSNQDICKKFINALKEENLVIKVDGKVWIPNQDEALKGPLIKTFFRNELRFELEIEEGSDLDLIKKTVDSHFIMGISYFGSQKIDKLFPSAPISYKVKDFGSCLSLCSVKPNFKKISESTYYFNLSQNSCWGRKIAITKDGMVRPCIHSNISVGRLSANKNFQKLIEKVLKYWHITKDKVETCRDCEFRYMCFDCREIAQRKNNGNLYAANPLCRYNPYTGKWHEHSNLSCSIGTN